MKNRPFASRERAILPGCTKGCTGENAAHTPVGKTFFDRNFTDEKVNDIVYLLCIMF